MKTNKTFTPLTPAVFHILLALASGEKHGYEMKKWTFAIALAIILFVALFVYLTGDWRNIFFPGLILAGLFCIIKSLSDREKKCAEREKNAWGRTEFLSWALLGLAAMVCNVLFYKGPDDFTFCYFALWLKRKGGF